MTVIDTSAVLAILQGERGADVAARHARGALLSAVNLIEVRSKVFDAGADVDAAARMLERLEIVTVPFTPDEAHIAADLWPLTKGKNISLADRACLATAIARGGTLVTADGDWAALDIDIDYLFIR